MSLSILEIQTPRVFAPLLQPARYKGAWGGRASGKSHFFAEMMVERALMEPGFRGAAIREIQKSTKLSVKQLIEDKIRKLGVSSRFEIRETEIRTPGDGLIIFQGMQDHTADSIKSLEGFDVAWCEEAQSLSDRSVKILRPTFRKPGSELWFSWNPENPEAPVDKLLRGEEHDDGWQVVVEANWRDNPWFGEEMEKERQRDLARDPDTYGWIWEGEYLVISDAQIFRNRVSVEPFETPVEVDRFFFGADWGFAMDPTALIRCFIRDECLYIDHEAGQASVEIDEIGAKVFDKVPGSRDWPIKADSARPETISYMRRQGYAIDAAEKWPGSVEDGIAHLKGFKRIIVHPRCENTAREFRLYRYKVDKLTGDVLPIIVDKHNHWLDALRYSLDQYIMRRGGMGVWARLAG